MGICTTRHRGKLGTWCCIGRGTRLVGAHFVRATDVLLEWSGRPTTLQGLETLVGAPWAMELAIGRPIV